jgi:Rrf2 family protein
MFKVSRRADYATRVLVSLAAEPHGTTLSAAELSARTDVPQPFIHKVAQDLARAGLIRTTAGTSGGAALLRSADSITLLDVIEAIEGPLCLNVCLVGPGACPRDATCLVHPAWVHIQSALNRELAAYSIGELAGMARLETELAA